MTRIGRIVLPIVVGTALGLGAAWLGGHLSQRPAMPDSNAPVTLRMTAIDGAPLQLPDPDGRWVLVNFWATWCAPCRREMPLLQDLHAQPRADLRIVGIAIDEPARVADFVDQLGIDYPIAVTDAQPAAFGNPEGLLPYTVLIDPTGHIRWRHLGELKAASIRQALGRMPRG